MSTAPANPECVPCPHCGGANVLEPVSVVRNDDEDNLKDLFLGALNRTECQRCSKSFLFETPILYRDDSRRKLIYFIPAAMCADRDAASRQLDEMMDLIFGDFDEEERPACVLTTSRSAFIEKIAVHRAGFDDRLIEYIKYQLFQHSEGLDHHRHEVLYDFANATVASLQFICFDRKTRKPTYSLEFDGGDYTKLAEWFLGEGRRQLDQLFPGHWVTVEDLFID